jgi:hypothetical protein
MKCTGASELAGETHLIVAYAILVGSLALYANWLWSRYRNVANSSASTLEARTPHPRDGEE